MMSLNLSNLKPATSLQVNEASASNDGASHISLLHMLILRITSGTEENQVSSVLITRIDKIASRSIVAM